MLNMATKQTKLSENQTKCHRTVVRTSTQRQNKTSCERLPKKCHIVCGGPCTHCMASKLRRSCSQNFTPGRKQGSIFYCPIDQSRRQTGIIKRLQPRLLEPHSFRPSRQTHVVSISSVQTRVSWDALLSMIFMQWSIALRNPPPPSFNCLLRLIVLCFHHASIHPSIHSVSFLVSSCPLSGSNGWEDSDRDVIVHVRHARQTVTRRVVPKGGAFVQRADGTVVQPFIDIYDARPSAWGGGGGSVMLQTGAERSK